MKLSLIFAAGAGFFASSAFEDAIRNSCEGRVPAEWVFTFIVFCILCTSAAILLRGSNR